MTPRAVKTWGGLAVDELRARWGREHVHAYGVVPSTNDLARELADDGAPAGTIVLGRSQTEGRGRSGGSWESPEGAGLYLSMIFRPAGATVTPLVTVLAGIDIALALERAFPDLSPRVKWPNDLIVGDRKLGGILAESSASDAGGQQLVVGVGVNLSRRRLGEGVAGAIALDEVVVGADLPDVADAVIDGLERRLHAPPAALDAAALDDADRLDWLKNRRVRHRLPDSDPVVGTAAGIAPDGALLLRPDRGALRRIVSGSVEPLEKGERS